MPLLQNTDLPNNIKLTSKAPTVFFCRWPFLSIYDAKAIK